MIQFVRIGARVVVEGLLTLLAVSIVIFCVGHLTGDPAKVLASQEATTGQQIEQLRRQLGLDMPLWHQYTNFLTDALHGNLGVSYATSQPVSTILKVPLEESLKLAACGVLLALAIAVPLGILAAVRRGTVWDKAAVLLATLGQAVPSFMVGLLLIIVFAVHLHWLPAAGAAGWSSVVLPAVALSAVLASGILRLLRSGMIEAWDSDYVRFGRSLGLKERHLLWRWALRNAFIPVIAFTTVGFAIMIGGAIAIEVVFSWPGMGQLAYNAVLSRDFPVIQGVVLTWAAAVIIGSMIADVLYRILDPRLRG